MTFIFGLIVGMVIVLLGIYVGTKLKEADALMDAGGVSMHLVNHDSRLQVLERQLEELDEEISTIERQSRRDWRGL